MATSSIDRFEHSDLESRYMNKIKTLSEYAWDHECSEPVVRRWLNCFDGRSGFNKQVERLHALHLLSNFLYFGLDEVRELLRALYRDIFQYRLIKKVRQNLGNSSNQDMIRRIYCKELKSTRFLPLGNPSESSSHLLYYFRQENDLPSNLFAYVHDILHDGYRAHANIKRCVFLDDFAGTGNQAIEYSKIASRIRAANPIMVSYYYAMISTPEAIKSIRESSCFDEVECVVRLTDDLRAFSENSLFYIDESPESPKVISKSIMKKIAKVYGNVLSPESPLGYGFGQLILGFSHNVPDNTLPIFSADLPSWNAPFPRRRKWSYR